jgi:hypothetical protein
MFLAVLSFLVIKSEFGSVEDFSYKADPILEVRSLVSNVFKNDKLSETIEYKHGYLEEPNQYIVRNKYSWKTYNKNRRIKYINGNSLIVQFKADNLLKIIAGANIKDVEFKNSFVLGATDYVLKSESATYYYSDEILLGTDPVYIDGKDTRVHSTDGFKVQLKKGDFELFGNVNGVIDDGQLFR